MVMMILKKLPSNFISSFNLCTRAQPKVLQVGDAFRQSRVFTISDVDVYSKVSHDVNPVHFDVECARSSGYDDPLVHGMLVASLFPHIISKHFPGAVYVSQNLQFKQPVYIGEEVYGEVQAINVRNFKKNHLIKFSTKCFNQGSLLVLDGEATAILPTVNY